MQAKILVTRQLLFSAVRQNVARSFIPSQAEFKAPDQHLLNVCREAAYRNLQLLYRLIEIVNTGDSAFGMIDYHNAFNAAIILELGRLYRHDDSPFNDTPQLGHVLDALQRGGQSGNEFARDCFIVLADFRQLSEKLIQEMTRRTKPCTLPLQSQSVQVPGNVPVDIFDNVPDASAIGLALEGPSPGLELELEKVLEEFTTWLEAGPF